MIDSTSCYTKNPREGWKWYPFAVYGSTYLKHVLYRTVVTRKIRSKRYNVQPDPSLHLNVKDKRCIEGCAQIFIAMRITSEKMITFYKCYNYGAKKTSELMSDVSII